MKGQEFYYAEGETRLKGYLVKPVIRKTGRPGVVILHARMGLTAHEKQSAERLAGLGYIALAADSFGEDRRPETVQEAIKFTAYYKTNRNMYRARISAAIKQLIEAGADPAKIAVMGYCFGGTGALEAARANLPVKAVVSFHGSLDKGSEPTEAVIKPKVLVLHGADDPFVPKAQVEVFQDEMRAAKADWQFVYYGGAVHSFTDPNSGTDQSKGSAYNEVAAWRSWEHMKAFLKEVLGE